MTYKLMLELVYRVSNQTENARRYFSSEGASLTNSLEGTQPNQGTTDPRVRSSVNLLHAHCIFLGKYLSGSIYHLASTLLACVASALQRNTESWSQGSYTSWQKRLYKRHLFRKRFGGYLGRFYARGAAYFLKCTQRRLFSCVHLPCIT